MRRCWSNEFQFNCLFYFEKTPWQKKKIIFTRFAMILFVWELLSGCKIGKKYLFFTFFCCRQHIFTHWWIILLNLKGLVVASICAKFYDIWMCFTSWKYSLNLWRWLPKNIWSFKFWSLKYIPTSDFRLGNNFSEKLQTMWVSAR